MIQVDNNTINKINEFVNNSVSSNSSYYRNRNQHNVDKIKQDIFNGKLAEFAVYNLISKKYNLSLPDINIYGSKNKSYSADLICGDYLLHIKSQHITSANSFGISWSFQHEDILTKNPSINDVIVFCLIHDDNSVEIMKKVKAIDIVDKYSEPKLDKLKGIKKIIYYDDIK